ncbi:MAG: AAA family ATPase [Aliidongia sp.]
MLADGRGGMRYVANITGRGYCFVAPVSAAGAAATAEGGAASAPAEPAPAMPETNLPRHLGALIGREVELAELRDSIGRRRLVTLVGTSGVGKTRLAIELGWQIMGRFPDGVWLIDLAPLTDPAVVISATATVLGVALSSSDAAVEAIAAAIGRQRRLLIVDNCEHLINAAAPLIATLLALAPGLSVLATSQETLRIPAEQIYRLNPLALPPPGLGEIAGFGAVALFLERARAADRGFVLDADNAAGVAEICRRLDGVPLALEMAAARLPLLGVEGLRAGLDERLRMLKTGPRTAGGRHQTLRNMVEWSHGLLDPADQRVFRRLAVFAGSFSLDAAVAVAGTAADRWDTVDALGRLIDKSLVKVESGEPPRYRLLETLRFYAAEQLAANDEAEAIAEHHARFFTELFEHADAVWETTPVGDWLKTHWPEIDNVRAALDWTFADPTRPRIAATLAGTAARLWDLSSQQAEGRAYLDRAVEFIDEDFPTAAAASVLRAAAKLHVNFDRMRALQLAERSADLYRALGDRLGLAQALDIVGGSYAILGRTAEAKTILQEVYETLTASGVEKLLPNVAINLGILSAKTQETAQALYWFTRALNLSSRMKLDVTANICLVNLAELEFLQGDAHRAIDHASAAVQNLRRLDREYLLATALLNLVWYLMFENNLHDCRAAAEEAFALVRTHGGLLLKGCLERWALLGTLEGRYSQAARLIGFTDALFVMSGADRDPTEQEIYDRTIKLLKARLPAPDLQAALADGAQMSEQQAVDFAFDHLVSPEHSRGKLKP